MSLPISPENASIIAAGLRGVIRVDGGPTDEQQSVYDALARHLLRLDDAVGPVLGVLAPADVGESLVERGVRRVFIQMAIMLELCCHPQSEVQLRQLEAYATELGMDGPEVEAVRVQAHRTAEAATADFVRSFGEYVDELSEFQLVDPETRSDRTADELWAEVERFDELPVGSVGWAFVEFYRRNGFTLPSRDSPAPAYYVSHDMNHVIAGYEPTGPGEIALGAFKLAMHDSEANWMASMVNLMIHEAGLIKHGSTAQFVPFGGAPYPGPDGQFGALSLPGAADLVAEAFERGAACSSDFSRADHLAMAHLPIAEVRERHHVIPLRTSMIADEPPGLWP
jgi:hypothetical protein